MTASIKSLAMALGGDAYSGNRVLCPGPGHSRHDRSLSVMFNADGTFVAKSFAGDDWKECRDHVKARLGLADDKPAPIIDRSVDVSSMLDVQRRIERARRIWLDCVPIAGTLAETYLASRRLTYEGEALAFHADTRAMVALMTDATTAEPCGIHRTFLDANGEKLDKKMLGRARGAVVRLYDHEIPFGLAVGEGIETTLAADFRPAWACLSANGLATLPVITHVPSLTIFADNDASGAGFRAANTCGERWHAAGREVTIAAPVTAGVDFADIRRAA
ncbi:MAG: toprim domain-containing protein [Allorhizobium sp.]